MPDPALVAEAGGFEQAYRGPVPGEDAGVDAVEPEGPERDPERSFERRVREALPPERSAEPVADLGGLPPRVDVVQPDTPDQPPVRVPDDEVGETLAAPAAGAGAPDVLYGVRLAVGKRDRAGPVVDRRVGEQGYELLRVANAGRDEVNPATPDLKRNRADPLDEGSRHLRPDRAARRLGKLRYIRDGIGCGETFRYFAERFEA